jgi:hypothetical protein
MELENIDSLARSLGLSDDEKRSLIDKMDIRLVDVVRSAEGLVAAKDVEKVKTEEVHPVEKAVGTTKIK